MNRIILNTAGLVTAAMGCGSLYLGAFGSLWQPGSVEYLGWSQLWVLRPGLFLTGSAAIVVGLYLGPLYHTLAARIWRGWRQDCEWERTQDQMARDCNQWPDPDYYGWTWRDSLRSLWSRRGCFVGRHDPDALSFCRGGEDGPRGTTCTDCGSYISRDDVRPPRPESSQSLTEMLWANRDDNVFPGPWDGPTPPLTRTDKEG